MLPDVGQVFTDNLDAVRDVIHRPPPRTPEPDRAVPEPAVPDTAIQDGLRLREVIDTSTSVVEARLATLLAAHA